MSRARKKSKTSKAPQFPGRLVKTWDGDETHAHEFVQIKLDDARLKTLAQEIRDITEKCGKAAEKVKAAKEEAKPLEQRRKLLFESIGSGTLEERRSVYKFANDDKGTVTLYDAETHEELQTRKAEYGEQQEEAFADDGDAE